MNGRVGVWTRLEAVQANCVAYGRQRDDRIISLIDEGKAFTRKQIESLFFARQKDGRRKCQLRLQTLVERQQLKRLLRSPHEPAIYYIKKPKNIDHALLVSQIYCEIMRQKPSTWIVKVKWYYSILNNMVICDLYLDMYDRLNKKREVIFIEAERHPSKRFDKDQKYDKVYKSNAVNEEWVNIKDGKAIFPIVLIVTDEELTVKHDRICFKVTTTQQVSKDIYSLFRR